MVHEHTALLIHVPDEGHPYAIVTWTGMIWGTSGMNDAGLAVAFTPSDSLDSSLISGMLEDILEPENLLYLAGNQTLEGLAHVLYERQLLTSGVPVGMAANRLLHEAEDVPAALTLLHGQRATYGWNYLLADATGDIAVAEVDFASQLGSDPTEGPAEDGDGFLFYRPDEDDAANLDALGRRWASEGPDDIRIASHFQKNAEDMAPLVFMGIFSPVPQRVWTGFYYRSVRTFYALGEAIAERLGTIDKDGAIAVLRTPEIVDTRDSMKRRRLRAGRRAHPLGPRRRPGDGPALRAARPRGGPPGGGEPMKRAALLALVPLVLVSVVRPGPARAGYTDTLDQWMILVDAAYMQAWLDKRWDNDGAEAALIDPIERYEPGGGLQGVLRPSPSAQYQLFVTQLQVGLLDNLSLGVGLPVVLRSKVDLGLAWEPGDYQPSVGRVYSEEDFWAWAQSMGQSKPEDWEGNKGTLSDMILGLRLRWSHWVPAMEARGWFGAVSLFAGLPTGKSPDPEQLGATGNDALRPALPGRRGVPRRLRQALRGPPRRAPDPQPRSLLRVLPAPRTPQRHRPRPPAPAHAGALRGRDLRGQAGRLRRAVVSGGGHPLEGTRAGDLAQWGRRRGGRHPSPPRRDRATVQLHTYAAVGLALGTTPPGTGNRRSSGGPATATS